MNASLRVGACAVVLFGAVLFVGCVLVPWLGGTSLFPADLRETCQQIIDERDRRDALDERDRLLLESLAAKREVTADVIAGRSALSTAVADFRRLRERLAEAQPELHDEFWAANPSDEAIARGVIAWVAAALQDDPCGGEILAGLEAELLAMCADPRPQARGRRRS